MCASIYCFTIYSFRSCMFSFHFRLSTYLEPVALDGAHAIPLRYTYAYYLYQKLFVFSLPTLYHSLDWTTCFMLWMALALCYYNEDVHGFWMYVVVIVVVVVGERLCGEYTMDRIIWARPS